MKKTVLLLLLLTAAGSLQAQTFNEWFRQKKTQKKYLVQQIIALQAYIGQAKKCYDTARKGLATIGDITSGELNLHGNFFHSLNTVSPAVRQYGKVASTLSLQSAIITNYNRTTDRLARGDNLSTDELSYIRLAYQRMLEDCEQILEELSRVTTKGNLEMSDDERISLIDRLYEQMLDNYSFGQDFGNEALVLASQRRKEKNNITTGHGIYGLIPEYP